MFNGEATEKMNKQKKPTKPGFFALLTFRESVQCPGFHTSAAVGDPAWNPSCL